MNDSKENLTTGGFSGTPQNAGRSGHRVENNALLIMVALCLLFIGLSMTVFKGTDFRADLDYLMAIQNFREFSHQAFNKFFLFITDFGSGKLCCLILIFIYFGFSTRLGNFIVQVYAYADFMNGLLKLTVCAFRPWVRDELILPPGDAKVAATGYSFPSGHSTGATAIFGGLILGSRQKSLALIIGAGLMLILVLFSRNYLGVHTPQDVFIGLLSTLALILVMRKIFRWLETGNQLSKKWILFVISLVLSTLAAVYYEFKSYPLLTGADGSLIVDPAKLILDSYKGIGYYIGGAASLLFVHYFRGYEAEKATAEQRIGTVLIALIVYYLVTMVLSPQFIHMLPARFAYTAEGFSRIFITFGILPVVAGRMLAKKSG